MKNKNSLWGALIYGLIIGSILTGGFFYFEKHTSYISFKNLYCEENITLNDKRNFMIWFNKEKLKIKIGKKKEVCGD